MNSTFLVRQINDANALQCIEEVGFDKSYLNKAVEKYQFKLYKIHNLTCPQATILKQTALSVGADVALHREVLMHNIDKTDLVLGATISQLRQLCKKLKYQPFSLKNLSEDIEKAVFAKLSSLSVRNTEFDWAKKTYIMGILNVTPDSFSDGGSFNSVEQAVKQAEKMIIDGVDIIDIGGESTRPFAEKVSVEIECERVIPVIKSIREINAEILISIDTRNAETAKQAVNCGADIINDVSGFDWDENMLEVVRKLNVPVIIMHSLTSPDKMQVNPKYESNIIDAVYKSLFDKVKMAIEAGIPKENIIIDPGVGFGKSFEDNIEIIERVKEFTSLGCAVLMGVSRKSVIGKILNNPVDEREEANIALNSYLAANGANIIRVHDVEKHVKAFKVIDKVIK